MPFECASGQTLSSLEPAAFSTVPCLALALPWSFLAVTVAEPVLPLPTAIPCPRQSFWCCSFWCSLPSFLEGCFWRLHCTAVNCYCVKSVPWYLTPRCSLKSSPALGAKPLRAGRLWSALIHVSAAVTLHSPNGLCCSVLCCSDTSAWLQDLHHGSVFVGTATLTEQCCHGTVDQCKWPSSSATMRLVTTEGCCDAVSTLIAVRESPLASARMFVSVTHVERYSKPA